MAGGKDDVEVLTGITPGLSDQDSSDVIQMLHEEPQNILYSFIKSHGLFGPIRGQYLGHVTSFDQSEASIHLRFSLMVAPGTGGQPLRSTRAGSPPQWTSIHLNTDKQEQVF